MNSAIICVDDERVVLQGLKDQLRRHFGRDHAIEVAESADEALELFDELKAARRDVPVVVSDQMMPGMTGDVFLTEIHSRDPRVRTVMLTGQATGDAVGAALNGAQLYRYLAKPWAESDLALTVREALKAWHLAREVERQALAIERAHAASLRFVPFEFLAQLGRNDLTQVTRGDAVQREMSVFFSDIRGFTTIFEAHAGEENVAWINEYLGFMEPPLLEHAGAVEGIAGDGVVALFGRAPDDAVRAGIASLRALEEYNRRRQARGDAPLRIGIGVNTGTVTLGVVGGTDRLKCTVLGDVVNVAARVEGLSKHIGSMLITGQTYARLVDPSRYALRFVDRVRVKGRVTPCELYEVLDGLPGEERARRLATRERFAEAVALIQGGDVPAATAAFAALAARDPTDRAVRWHLERCRTFADTGLPPGWDGTMTLEKK